MACGTQNSTSDFSIWELQEPSGSGNSPTTISPDDLVAGYSDNYFYIADDGGQAFMDTESGITTPGSTHCRTEMREMNSDGSHAAWGPSGTNTMDVTGMVTSLGGGSDGKVTVGQVFNSDDSVPLCELQYSASVGGFVLLYEEAKGQGSTIDLQTPVDLNTQYSFQLSFTNDMLTVSINDNQVYSYTPSSDILTKTFYFKCGNYDQTSTSGGVTTTPYTIVEDYSINVVHNSPGGVTIQDGSGNNLDPSVSALTQSGPAVDIGPTAGTASIIVGHNQALNETALVDGLIKPGLPGDTETITSVTGNATLSSSTVTYNSPASGADSFTYTVQDQLGDTATGTVNTTVDPGPSITAVMPSVVEKGQTTEIGTVATGLAGDTLTLKQTGGSGVVALQLVNGVEEVIYTAPSTIPASTQDTVSYTITDQYNDAAASGSVAVQTRRRPEHHGGDAVGGGERPDHGGRQGDDPSDSVTAGASSSIHLGNGNDIVNAGANGTIIVGNGNDTIFAGADDLINLGKGYNTVAFAESPNSIAIGNETITGFNPAHDILQFNPALLANYAAGIHDAKQVGANTVIQIDTSDSVPLNNLAPAALSANNFHFA